MVHKVEEVKSVMNMTAEELRELPVVNVRFGRRNIVDRRTNKVTGVTHTAEMLIHNLLAHKEPINQAQFGLAMLKSKLQAANQFVLPSFANYSKGVRKDGSKYFFAEFYVSSDLILRGFFSKDEVKLLNNLVKEGELTISFKERPEDDEPKIDVSTEEISLI